MSEIPTAKEATLAADAAYPAFVLSQRIKVAEAIKQAASDAKKSFSLSIVLDPSISDELRAKGYRVDQSYLNVIISFNDPKLYA